MSKIKSRKLWVSLIVHASNVWLIAQGHIEPEHFVTLTLFTLAGWVGGEMNEKWIERK